MTTRSTTESDARGAGPIRVLAVAELATTCEALAHALEPVGWIRFGACRPDPDALASAVDPPPRVAIVVGTPDVPLACPAVQRVLEHLPDLAARAALVAVTGVVDAHDARATLALGATGYLAIADGFGALEDAVRHAADGLSFVGPSVGVALARDAAIAARSGLDDRERDVLRLVALGFTAAEAAVELGLSVRSVEAAKQRVGDRLGLRSRRELVAAALDLGLLDRAAV